MSTAATTSASALPRAASAAPRGHDLGRLLVRCQDRPGIVSAVSTFLTRAAYYLVAEALTNAAKHADASTIHIEIDTVGTVLRVSVRDDGRGAPTSPAGPAWSASRTARNR